MKRLLFLALLVAWLGTNLVPVPVQAQASLRVLATSAQADFPQSITFKVQAQSQSNITKLALRYEVEAVTCIPSIINEAWPDFTPASRVEASWTYLMKRTGGLPPGARLKYWWLVQDASGQRLETPPSALEFEDKRYSWRSLSLGTLTLYWYEGDQNFARRLLEAGQGALNRMAQDTGAELKRPVRIFIYNSTAALQGAQLFAPSWEGGVAFPKHGLVAIGVPPSQISWGETSVAHELTHVLNFEATLNCYGQIPPWLNEGLAVYAEGPLETNQQRRLEQAAKEDRLFSARTLSGPFPAQTDGALLSYAQSYSLVNFLIKSYGRDKIVAFLGAFKAGQSQEEALRTAFNLGLDELDARWRASVGAPPRPTPRQTPVPERTLAPTPVPTPVAPTTVPTPLPATPAPRGFFGCRAPGASVPYSTPGPKAGLWLLGIVMLGGLGLLARRRGRP